MSPLWTDIASAAGVTLSPEQTERLHRYLDLLIEKNQVLNLTRITDRGEAEVKHVADALALLRWLPAPAVSPDRPHQPLRLADVGTGGGIPGAILAIARPDLSVTLIDATRKKLDAVQGICEAIGVTNVRTQHTRMEEVRLRFDVVTARAVAELETLLGWCRGLVGPKGRLLAMKGPRATEEIARLSPRTRKHWEITLHEASIPALEGHLTLVCTPRG